MDEVKAARVTKPLSLESHFSRTLLIITVVALGLGAITGYSLSRKSIKTVNGNVPTTATAINAQVDNKTFKDFAEGTIKVKPSTDDYSEGSHLLQRDNAYPVALTSSVVDLSKYEGKKVKVFGETQKALKEGWLMDVGKVEEIK